MHSRSETPWFPRPDAPTDVRVVGVGDRLTSGELFRLLVEPSAVEWRHKVGVVGPIDGSAKPTTRLIVAGGWVLKTNVALGTTECGATSRARKGAELANRARLWHPDKTWGVFRSGALSYPFSATPELTTLRWAQSKESKLKAWTTMLTCAVEAATNYGIGLDLNPANFGTAAGDPRLYYLDDEWYPELTFAEIASAVVARIPEEPDIDAGDWETWGAVTARVLQTLCWKADARSELVAKIAEHPLAAQFEMNRKALCAGLRCVLLETTSPESLDIDAPRSGGERIAVIADVHANIEALEAVLREAESLGVDGYLFAGDAVGYGPSPRECVQRLAELPNARYVRGNHDHAIGTGVFSEGMNQLARSCADWTYAQLSTDERQWLLALPLEAGDREWLAVHGAPRDPKRFLAYVYELTFQDNLEHLAIENLELCFCGHTHVQFVHERATNGRCRKLGCPPTVLVGGERILLVNPGSVGQPRDHDSRAAFAVWDRREHVIHLHRVAYDVAAVAAAIRASDLPTDLARRLSEGR